MRNFYKPDKQHPDIMKCESWAGGRMDIQHKKIKETNSGILKLSDIYIIGSSQRERRQTFSTCFLPITEKEVCCLKFLQWLIASKQCKHVTYYFPRYVSQYSIMQKFNFSSYLQGNVIIPFKRGLTFVFRGFHK